MIHFFGRLDVISSTQQATQSQELHLMKEPTKSFVAIENESVNTNSKTMSTL